MDSYILTIKYIFNKYNKESNDSDLNDFFSNGISFPQFIAILFDIDKIPGTSISKNKFQIANNNIKALAYLGQKSPFFSSYQVNFSDEKNQQSLIQLILSKVYFKTTKFVFQKKCNDFLKPFDQSISNFSELVQGTGFMKLLNVVSNGIISSELKCSHDQAPDIIINTINSLNIPVIIDKTAFLPSNQDFLLYQALIIMEHKEDIHPPIQQASNDQQQSNKVAITNPNNELKPIHKTVSFNSSQIANPNDKNKNDEEKSFQSENQQNNNTKSNSNEAIKLNESASDSNIPLSSKLLESSDILNLPKTAYLNIVNNLMESNNMQGIVYISDFEKGTILPQIAEILLKTKVPNILENPVGAYDQLMNNMSALLVISQNDSSINPRGFIMSKEDDIKSLIRILFTKFVITKEYCDQMLIDCNLILQKYKIHINNFNVDWDNGMNFVALLNFVSNEAIIFPPTVKLNIDVLKDLFIKANCISILEDDSIFGNVDEFVISYQIKLIFDEIKKRNLNIPNDVKNDEKTSQKSSSIEKDVIESTVKVETIEKVNLIKKEDEQIQKKETTQKVEPIQKVETSTVISNAKNETTQKVEPIQKVETSTVISNAKNETAQKVEPLQKVETSPVVSNAKYVKKSYKFNYQYVKESCPVLRVLNAIGPNINLHYDTLDDVINGMTLHILVQYLADESIIPGIKNDKKFEQMNINAVMNFLRDKSTVFKYTTFDFSDNPKKKDNIIWFITMLLKQFFLKESKSKMLQKAGELIGEKIYIRDIKRIFTFGNGFLKIFEGKNIKTKNFYDEASILSSFQKVNVPFILDEESLTNVNDDYICFQLKLIFDYYIHQEKKENESPIPSTQPSEENKANQQQSTNKIEKLIQNSEKEKELKNDTKLKDGEKKAEIKKSQKKEDKKEDKNLLSKLKKVPLFNLKKTLSQKKGEIKTENQSTELDTKAKPIDIESQTVELMKNKFKSESENPNENKKEHRKSFRKLGFNIDDPESIDQNPADIYELYSYNLSNYESEINDSKINDDFFRYLKDTLSDFVKQVKSEESAEKDSSGKYVSDKSFNVFRLFEYKSNQWIFNKKIWPEFLKKNKLNHNDILYWILLLPSCTTDKNVSNDLAYNLIKTISASDKIVGEITDDVYVEMGFCGNINDVQKRFGIQCVPTKYEHLAIIQLRYPPSFKDNPCIINMQVALSLQADYIISGFPKISISQSIHTIKTTTHQANLSDCFMKKQIGITQLFLGFNFEASKEFVELTHNPNFQTNLYKRLKSDTTFQSILKYYNEYEQLMVIYQWINMDDYKTYASFLETIIDFCQNNTQRQSMVINITKTIPLFCDVGFVCDQKNMANFMYIMNKVLDSNTKTNNLPLFKYNPYDATSSIINFNKAIWNEFIRSNGIDESSLYLILFNYSDPNDVNKISKVFSNTLLTDIYKSNIIRAQIGYCGLMESFAGESKEKEKSQKYHLAFIYVQNSLDKIDEDYLLFFELVIASKCDVIITIPNKDIIQKQLIHNEKMMTALDIYKKTNETIKLNSLHNKYRKDKDKDKEIAYSHKHIYLFRNDINHNQNKEMLDLIPNDNKTINLDIFNSDSCYSFRTSILKLFPRYEDYYKIYEFDKINDANNIFFFSVFRSIRKITSDNKNENKDKNLSQYFIDSEDQVGVIRDTVNFFIERHQTVKTISILHKYFLSLLIDIGNISDLVYIVNNIIKKKVIDIYISHRILKTLIDPDLFIELNANSFTNMFNEVKNNIITSVTYVDDEFIEYNKNLLREKIKKFIFNYLETQCKKNNFAKDLLCNVYNQVLNKIKPNIDKIINSIDTLLQELVDIKQYNYENIEYSQEQIEQESMKYILAVKESFKEMTVELTCDEDLEKEIPQDF